MKFLGVNTLKELVQMINHRKLLNQISKNI